MRRGQTLLAILFLILLPPVFFWRETLGWLTLGDQDAVFWFFPAYQFVVEQIKSGQLPLWSPFLYSGTPLFAQWQAGMLDPINWIHLIETTSRSLTLSLEISFAVSLLATFSYTRSLGFARRACIVSAIIYSLSGFAVGRTLYPGFLHIIALAPFVLFFTERLAQRGRWRDVAGGALIIAWQLFAAHPQPLIYSSLLASAYALFRLRIADFGLRIEERRQLRVEETIGDSRNSPILNPQSAIRNQIRFFLQFAVMFITGAGLAAVQLFPAWEIARESVRREWPYELFTLHSLHPVSLLTTLFPFFHGSGKTIYEMPYWGVYWHHNEAQIYLGVLSLSLGLAGAAWAARSRYLIGVFWSAVGVIGVILAMGKYTGPLARMLYHIPLISHFRSPNRHWMEVSLACAVLAGYAVDRLLREELPWLSRCLQFTAGVLALICCAVGGFVLWRKDAAESMIRALPDLNFLPNGFLQSARAEFYLPMVLAAGACLTLFLFVRSRQRSRFYWVLLVFLLIDLQLYAVFAPISNPFKLETLIGRAMPRALADQQSEREPFRYHIMLNAETGEFSPFWFSGHEMATGYDPMLNERYKIFSGIDEAGRSYLTTMLDDSDQTLDLLNVRYVFLRSEAQKLNAPRWRESEVRSEAPPYRGFRIYENTRFLPRVWLVNRIKAADEGDQLKLIRGETTSQGESGFDPRATALVDHETSAKLDQRLQQTEVNAPAINSARISSRSPTRMLIETEAGNSSILVLSEIAQSGWQLKVDGNEAEILRADYNLRGATLTAGKHQVEFVYRSRSLMIGTIVSIVTALVLLCVILVNKRDRETRETID